jgi:hypothetical protein
VKPRPRVKVKNIRTRPPRLAVSTDTSRPATHHQDMPKQVGTSGQARSARLDLDLGGDRRRREPHLNPRRVHAPCAADSERSQGIGAPRSTDRSVTDDNNRCPSNSHRAVRELGSPALRWCRAGCACMPGSPVRASRAKMLPIAAGRRPGGLAPAQIIRHSRPTQQSQIFRVVDSMCSR